MSLKEIKVPNYSNIYKIMRPRPDGTLTPTGDFRVRKRYELDGCWKTYVATFNSFDEAKSAARRAVPPIGPTPHRQRIRFDEAFKKFMHYREFGKKVSKGTMAGYWVRYAHLKFFEPFEVSGITSRVVDAWLDLLSDPEYLKQQQSSRRSYEHEFVILNALFRFVRNHLDEGFINPILDRHRERACAQSREGRYEIRFLSPMEEGMFLEALNSWPVIRDIARFQLHTGARVGEAAAMEFRNVDFSRGEVWISQHLHWERHKDGKILVLPGTKGGPSRSVPMTAECAEMLRRRKAGGSGIVFPTDSGSWLAYRSIQSLYDRAFKRLELPQSGTHVLRHTFAVRFLDQTKDIYALQRVLGHTNLEVTQIYAKYTNESVRRSFQLFRGGLSSENEGSVTPLVTQTSL